MGHSIPSGCDPDPSLVPLEEEPRLEDLRLDTVLQDDKVKLTMPRSRIKRYNNIGQSEINLLIDEIEAKNHRGGYCHEHLNRCEYQVTECRYWDRDLTEDELERKKMILAFKVNQVGSFAGPWDRSITDDLTLGETTLTYDEYTKFQHEQKKEHFELKINYEKYESLEVYEKMDALEIKETKVKGSISGACMDLQIGKDGLDKVFYTCEGDQCKIPCPCENCVGTSTENYWCEVHREVKHGRDFDSETELYTIRNSDSHDISGRQKYSVDEDFGTELDIDETNKRCCQRSKPCKLAPYCQTFDRIKFAGIPKDCELCRRELLNHEAYHLVIHSTCKFCKVIEDSFDGIGSEDSKSQYWMRHWNKKYNEMFSCKICEKVFMHKKNINHHMEYVHEKHNKPLLSCTECEFSTVYKNSLKDHVNKVHRKNYIYYECDKCEYKSVHKKNVAVHKITVHECSIHFSCHVEGCDYVTNLKHNVTMHIKTVHEDTKYKCDHCIFFANSDKNLKEHEKRHHEKQPIIKCNLCEYITDVKANLTRHKKNVHEKPKIKCDICEYETQDKNHLIRHNETVHEKKLKQKIKCDLCEYETEDKSHLIRHNETVHEKKLKQKIKCDLCEYETEDKSNLIRHKGITHEKKLMQKIKCDICEYETENKSYLIRHKKTVHEKKLKQKIKCDFCKYETEDKSNFNKHKKMHQHPYECDKCEFRTMLQDELVLHKKMVHGKAAKP